MYAFGRAIVQFGGAKTQFFYATFFVQVLTALDGGLRDKPAWTMHKPNARFYFIDVLSAFAAGAKGLNLAFG